MSVQQGGVTEVREDVAVEDQKLLREPIEDRHNRAHGAERLVLGGVVDVESPLLAAANIGADQLAEMADGDGDAPKAVPGELAQHDLEDRAFVADRHEWLGDTRRVGTQASALATGEDDGMPLAHWVLIGWLIPCTSPICSGPGSPAGRTTRRSRRAHRPGPRWPSSRWPRSDASYRRPGASPRFPPAAAARPLRRSQRRGRLPCRSAR